MAYKIPSDRRMTRSMSRFALLPTVRCLPGLGDIRLSATSDELPPRKPFREQYFLDLPSIGHREDADPGLLADFPALSCNRSDLCRSFAALDVRLLVEKARRSVTKPEHPAKVVR